MDEILIAAIAPNSDTAQIEQVLQQKNIDMTRVSVVTRAKAQAKLHDGHHGGEMKSAATIMTGSGGTGVPGMGGGGASLSSFGHGDAPDYLGGLPMISYDQAHHYNIAISEGRALITYKATPDEASAAETAFREAGLRNIKTFKPKENVRSG